MGKEINPVHQNMVEKNQTVPRAHNNKIGTSPPPHKKKPKIPSLKREFLSAWRLSCGKNPSSSLIYEGSQGEKNPYQLFFVAEG